MKLLLKIILPILIAFNSFAWNDHAHMVVAAVAWDRLEDDQKAKVTALLEQHPEFQNQWKGAYHNYKDLLPLGKYLMMRASTWPDEIKLKSNLNYTYNRPEWHYIVQKLYFNKPVNEDKPEVQNSKDGENIVWAINHCIKSINGDEISIQLKAVYFSWLIHLTADIHQPLHTCALFDDDKLKKGDRGGNLIYFKTANDTTDLQGFWDERLGTSSNNVRKILQQGFICRKNKPYISTYTEEMNPETWAIESFKVAKKTAYWNGKLKIVNNSKAPIPQFPQGYEEESLSVAMERATIAGYRLAELSSTKL